MKKYINKIVNNFIETKENKLWAMGFIALGILSILPEKDFTFFVFTLIFGIPAFFSKA